MESHLDDREEPGLGVRVIVKVRVHNVENLVEKLCSSAGFEDLDRVCS